MQLDTRKPQKLPFKSLSSNQMPFRRKRQIKSGADCYLSDEPGLFLVLPSGETAAYGRSHDSLEAVSRMLMSTAKHILLRFSLG